jgi:hypothetical protein
MTPDIMQKGRETMAVVRGGPGLLYSGRTKDKVIRTLTIDREADVILRQYCPTGTKRLGAFLSRLLFEFRSREEERQKMARKILEG